MLGIVALRGDWGSVLIDQYVGLVFGASLVVGLSDRQQSSLGLLAAPLVGFLVLIKASGTGFALVACTVLTVDALLRRGSATAPGEGLRRAGGLAALWLLPMLVGASWNDHVERQHLRHSMASASVKSLVERFAGCCRTDREGKVVGRYFEAVFGQDQALEVQGELVSVARAQWGHLSFRQLMGAKWDSPAKSALMFLGLGLAICLLDTSRGGKTRLGVAVRRALLGGHRVRGHTVPSLFVCLLGLRGLNTRVLGPIPFVLPNRSARLSCEPRRRCRTSGPHLGSWRGVVRSCVRSLSLEESPNARDLLVHGARARDAMRSDIQRRVRLVVDGTPDRSIVFLVWQSRTIEEVGFRFGWLA